MKKAKSVRNNFIASTFPIIALLTLFIYPFVMSIMLLCNSERYENKGLAIASGVLGLLLGPTLIPFIMGCCLKPKDENANVNINNNFNNNNNNNNNNNLPEWA